MEDEGKLLTVPLICKESSDRRFYNALKWLIVALLVTNIAWAGTWVAYWLSPSYNQAVTVESSDSGNANYIGGEGDIVNGEDISR